MNRREALRALGATTLGLSASQFDLLADDAKPRNHIKQSVCRWCYGRIPLPELAAKAAAMGYKSIELLGVDEFKEIEPFGLTCAMMRCRSIPEGLNRPKFHDQIEKELRTHLEFAATKGIPNVICMSGNRGGMPDDEALANCAAGLKRVVGLAEEKKVTICMELLNSKVDHKDYQCDNTAWGVALVNKVGSPRFKLLYDIYHMAVMGEDVIPVIKANKDYFAHYHTGGVPGRNEIDDTQTLKYPEIVRAILDTGYEGYLGQEFIPKRDPLTSLAQAFKICDV